MAETEEYPLRQPQLMCEHLKVMVDDWLHRYKLAASERARLHEHEWDRPMEVSALDLLEVIPDRIHGHVLSIIRGSSPSADRQQLEDLRSQALSQYPELLHWIDRNRQTYPQIVELFERIDYTRLVLLAAIEDIEHDRRQAG